MLSSIISVRHGNIIHVIYGIKLFLQQLKKTRSKVKHQPVLLVPGWVTTRFLVTNPHNIYARVPTNPYPPHR